MLPFGIDMVRRLAIPTQRLPSAAGDGVAEPGPGPPMSPPTCLQCCLAYVSDGFGQCDGFRGTAAGKDSAAIHDDRLRGTVRRDDRLRGTATARAQAMPCSSGRLGVGLPGRAPFRGRLRVSSHSWSPSPLARRAGPGLGGTAARALTRLLSRTCFGHDPFRRGQPCPESCIPAGAPGVAETRCHRPLCPVRRWHGQRHAHFLAVQLGDLCSRFRSRRECARWPQALRSSSEAAILGTSRGALKLLPPVLLVLGCRSVPVCHRLPDELAKLPLLRAP